MSLVSRIVTNINHRINHGEQVLNESCTGHHDLSDQCNVHARKPGSSEWMGYIFLAVCGLTDSHRPNERALQRVQVLCLY